LFTCRVQGMMNTGNRTFLKTGGALTLLRSFTAAYICHSDGRVETMEPEPEESVKDPSLFLPFLNTPW
jgi:hypothetical protein